MSENLDHSGVKGMKWGVRKRRKYPVGPIKVNPPKLQNTKPVGPGTGHRDYDIKKLSNRELKKVVERMALEKRYNEINAYPGDKNKFDINSFIKDQGRGLMNEIGKAARKEAAGAIVGATLGASLKAAKTKENTKKKKS